MTLGILIRYMCWLALIVPLGGFPTAGAQGKSAYDQLLQAVRSNDVTTAKALISRGMDPDTADRDGTTLLMMAAREGHVNMARLLLAPKARADEKKLLW